jgi:HD-like signal output (HDOD) protein
MATDSAPGQRAYDFLQALAADLSSRQISFPTFTGATIRVRTALADPGIDVERLARAISAEPLLPARLIHIANSVAMNPGGKPVSDVRSAVMRVGHDVVRSTAVALAMEQLKAAKDVQSFTSRPSGSGGTASRSPRLHTSSPGSTRA